MSTVTVIVVSPDIRTERRVDLHLTVRQLKEKLETVTGIPAQAQSIGVFQTEDDATVSAGSASSIEMVDNDRLVGYYGVTNGIVLKVSDTSPPGASLTGQFTDVSQVEKFEITGEEYAARQDTVLAYKQRNKLGRFADASSPAAAALEPSTSESAQAQIIRAYPIGSRCEVDHGDGSAGLDTLKKRGTVRFVGTTSFGTGVGVWVGVEYDEPVGKNDGSVQGRRYFTSRPSYGGFVRPEKVKIGDFPPLDLGLDDEEI